MLPAKRVLPPSTWASEAERIVWHLDNSDGDDRRFRHEIFRQWPNRIAFAVAKAYLNRYRTHGLREANLFLLDMQEKFKPANMALAWSDDDLVSEAERASKRCREALELYPRHIDEVLRLLLGICKGYGLDAAITDTDTVTRKSLTSEWGKPPLPLQDSSAVLPIEIADGGESSYAVSTGAMLRPLQLRLD